MCTATLDSLVFNFISFRLISFRSVSLHFISFHFTSLHFISSRFISVRFEQHTVWNFLVGKEKEKDETKTQGRYRGAKIKKMNKEESPVTHNDVLS